MNTTDDAANTDDLSEPAREPDGTPVTGPSGVAEPPGPEKDLGRKSSAGLTVVLVLALWVAIVLVLATGQIILNRSFGADLQVGSLPGVWDWVLTAAIVLVTWLLVSKRHPKIGA